MRRGFKFLGMIVLVVAGVAVVGEVVMLLWNAVVPALFANARLIDYPHALGLLVLSRILFGGFRGRSGRHAGRPFGRWQAMTPEEREKLRCGPWGRRGRDQETA